MNAEEEEEEVSPVNTYQFLLVFSHIVFLFSLQGWGLRREEWVHPPILLCLSLVLLLF